MSSAQIREPASFGKRKEPHTIVVTQNGKSKTFNVNPIYFSIGMCFAFMLMIGYLGATAYLIFRDDLIEASFSKQARVQHEYEDRIAALRAKLDRVTSRQLLDQQQIETRVSELMARQANIGKRSNKMNEILNKAKKRGLGANTRTGAIPVPSTNPQKAVTPSDPIKTGSIETKNAKITIASAFAIRGSMDSYTTADEPQELQTFQIANTPKLTTQFTTEIFGDVADAIGIIDANQRQEIDELRMVAANKTQKIANILKSVGANIPLESDSGIGGPFTPLDHSVDFELHLNALETTLEKYDEAANLANALPLKNPIPGAKISSRYGTRVDPFNGRTAMHGGIDFKAARGAPVRVTGDGLVVRAGRKGGYGKIVEVKHANGLVTRYAHLSRINVKKGQRLKAGHIVGKVGSTGRSTGPHLHYEVRSRGKARNPAIYLNTGYKLRGLI